MPVGRTSRRAILAAFAGTAVSGLVTRAQPALTVVGLLSALSQEGTAQLVAAFREGLSEAGYIDGRSITLSYCLADGHYDAPSGLAADLVRRNVSLIVAIGPPAALAAKAATTTIPVVFVVGFDPIAAGLVTSLNRPESISTGIALFSAQLRQKRLEPLRELLPNASNFAMLVNPLSPEAPFEVRDDRTAAQAMGARLRLLTASANDEIQTAFMALGEERPDALLIGSDPLFMDQREKVVRLPLPARPTTCSHYSTRSSPARRAYAERKLAHYVCVRSTGFGS